MSSRSTKDEARGFTLVEVLVASFVALLLLGVIVSLIVHSSRISIKGANQIELQQRSLLVGERLASDLRSTMGAGLGLLESGTDRFVTIHPRQPEVGTVAWQEKVIVYEWIGPGLRTYFYEKSPAPTDAFKPPLSELAGLSQGEKTVTLDIKGVPRFEVEVEPGPLVKMAATFEKDDQKIEVQRVFFLRQGI